MKNLIQKVFGPLVLMGMLAGPVHADNKLIDLENGYSAESDSVSEEINLLTLLKTEEIQAVIHKVDGNYQIDSVRQTSKYRTTPTKEWDSAYDKICSSIDDGDKSISEMEIQTYLRSLYNSQLKWFEDDGNGNPVEIKDF
jgi:hypothetical protein